VELERNLGRVTVAQRRGATDAELSIATTDVRTGMFYSNLVMYFILLTTAATLHAHGMTNIETAQQAAEALGPLAGKGDMAEGVTRRTGLASATILRRDRAGHDDRFRRTQCGEDVVLVRRSKWRVGAATRCSGCNAEQRSESDGRAHQLSDRQYTRVSLRRRNDYCSGGDADYLKQWTGNVRDSNGGLHLALFFDRR
jgi:hypothetical protein